MLSVPETATARRHAGRPRVIHQPASSPGLRPVHRAIGYVRVSSADQVTNGFGLDAQRQAITAYATAQGWELVSVEEDQGISGTHGVADTNRDGTPRRPGLVAVLDALETGQADALIVRALDRIGRAPAVCADVFSRIDRARATFASITEPALSSDLLRGLFAGMASDERRRILERTREGRLQKIAQGGPVGAVPYGYRLVGSRREARVAIHEPEAVIVRRIHALRTSGKTMQAITAILNAEGIPAITGMHRVTIDCGQDCHQFGLLGYFPLGHRPSSPGWEAHRWSRARDAARNHPAIVTGDAVDSRESRIHHV